MENILYRGYNICRYFTRNGFEYLVYYIGYSLRGTTVSVATYPLTMRSIRGGTLGWNIVIGRAKRAPLWGVQSRFLVIYMLSVCWSMSVECQINCVGGITYGHAHAQSLFLAVKPVTPLLFISYTLEL